MSESAPTLGRVRRKALTTALLAAAAFSASAFAADGISLSATGTRLLFGTDLILSGKAPNGPVDLLAQPCGFTEPTVIAHATSSNGAYRFKFQPTLNTTFLTRSGSAESVAISVAIRPHVELRRVAAGRYQVDVSTGAGEFFTKSAVIERRVPSTNRWIKVASAP